MLALAAAAAAATAVHAQEIPTVLSPLRVETDHNGVNLVTGRMTFDLPTLSVPGAPNLRFDRIQNAAPYVKGTIEGSPGEYATASYSVHSGAAASESFTCFDLQDCSSVTGTGSTFQPMGTASFRYRQAGSGALYIFDKMLTNTLGPPRRIQYYASSVSYPNGEVISYTYQTAVGGAFNQTYYRPSAITSNLGFYIVITYVSDDFNSMYWNSVSEATLYSSAAPATPLGRLTYGATIRDLGGREFTCLNCHGIEVTSGSLQLPGEGSPALQVAAVQDAQGQVKQLVQSVTRDGVPWTYSYSYNNGAPYFHAPTNAYWYHRLTVAGPNGFNQVYNFTISGHRNVLTGVTDSINRATGYQFDEAYRPTRIVSPEGNAVNVFHDIAGNIGLRRTTARPGTPVTPSVIEERAFYPIADLPNLCTVLCWRPLWSRDGLLRQTDYAYNYNNSSGQPTGLLTEQTDPADANGVRRRTIIEYETSAEGVSRRRVVRICGDITTCGTSAEIRTEYVYGGPVLLPTVERRIDAAQGVTLETLYTYDLSGRVLSVDGPLPGSDDKTYNRYDVHGRRTWEIGGRAPGGLRIATRTEYRASDDRPIYTETGTIPDPDSDALTVFRRTDLAYDERRNAVREAVSAAGATRSVAERSFDDRGQLLCTAVRMDPAAFGSPPTDACTLWPQGTGSNNFGPDRITRNVYDAAGQRLQLREGVGVTGVEAAEATWAYNLNGQVRTVIDGNGNRAELRYDGHGRQDRWTFPSAAPRPTPNPYNDATQATALATAGSVNAADYEEYGYDAAGNRTSLRKRDGSVLTYQYDALNRMIVKVVPERAGLPEMFTRDVYYSYDLRGLLTDARFGAIGGEGVANTYDGFGRLASSRTSMAGTNRTLEYQYDAAGNRIRITHPDGPFFSTVHEGMGRFSYTLENGGTTLLWLLYADQGYRNVANRPGGGAGGWNESGDGRLIHQSHYLAGQTLDLLTTFEHNPARQIASRTSSNPGSSPGQADAYAWTRHHQMNLAFIADGLNRYTQVDTRTYDHDDNGNVTWDGARLYDYDVENRLIWASGASSTTLVYDPLGRLFQLTHAGNNIQFLYDGDALVAEYNTAGEVANRYVHGPGVDAPIAWYEGAAVNAATRNLLLADELGSIIAVTDGMSNMLTRNAYDEYGIPGETNLGRFQYTGQIWLPSLGMYYYKARAYSPTLGRFMQTDPIGYDDQFNLYAYVGNDPVNRSDPTGQYECKTTSDCRAAARGVAEIRAARNFYRSPDIGSRIARAEPAARALDKTLSSLGTRFDGGVNIRDGNLPGTDRGQYNSQSNTITLDTEQIRRTGGRIGEILGHETQHYRLRHEDLGRLSSEARPLAMQYIIGVAPGGTIRGISAGDYVRQRLNRDYCPFPSRICNPAVERAANDELQKPF